MLNCTASDITSQLWHDGSARETEVPRWLWTAAVLLLAMCSAAGVAPFLFRCYGVCAQIMTYCWRRSYTGASGTPEPPQVPGIPLIWSDGLQLLTDMHGYLDRRHARYGKCFQSWIADEKIVFLRGWKPLCRLLGREHDVIEGCFPTNIRRLQCEYTVPTVYHEDHRQLRKLLNPTFTAKATAGCTPKIAAIMQENLAAWATKGRLRAYIPAKELTFQVVMRVLLSFPDSFVEDGTMRRMLQLLQIWLDAFLSFPFRVPGLGFDKGFHAREALRDLLGEHLPAAGGNSWRENEADMPTSVQRVFYRPPHHPEALPLDKQKDLAINLIFAGYDTCASAIHFLLRELYFNPHCMQALRDEQKQIMAKHGEEITEDAVQDMHYARACVKEVLRLHPSVNYIFRRALCDFEYEGFTIKKGRQMFIDLRDGMLHDERWADQAGTTLANDRYAPERWFTAEGSHNAGWLPFGSGLRMCLGYHIAMSELKVWCAVMARNYEWVLTRPSARTIKGVFMRFEDDLEIDIKLLANAV